MSQHKPIPPEKHNENAKAVLITGSAKRIGTCMAETLRAAGMNIMIRYHTSFRTALALQQKSVF